MSTLYDPDKAAQLDSLGFTVALSNRDISGQVPIDFVTHPEVSITLACFADRTYDPTPAAKCISNLLATQFRRLVIDLYWDSGYRQFNLCPVAFPIAVSNPTSSIQPTLVTAHTVSTAGNASTEYVTLSPSQNGTASHTPSNTTSSPSSTTTVLTSTTTGSNGDILTQIGPYKCSQSLDLNWVASLLADYVVATADTVDAKVAFVEFNLHAASSFTAPDEPAATPRGYDLPQSTELISAHLTNVSTYVYTPSLLAADRSNLNRSWFDFEKSKNTLDRHPILEYFTTNTLPNGDLSTSDGWPNENYILITRGMRLLLSWGQIDPQMARYNFKGDAGLIFSSQSTIRSRQIQANGAGNIVSGCFFNEAQTAISKENSSWAQSVQAQAFAPLINNLTTCGISPLLNGTLANEMANNNFAPYKAFADSAVWNWAAGEPRNNSGGGANNDNTSPTQFRCALLDITSAYQGHWRVADCSKSYPVACRVNNQPYVWQLSSNKVPFSSGPSACSVNSTFAAPAPV